MKKVGCLLFFFLLLILVLIGILQALFCEGKEPNDGTLSITYIKTLHAPITGGSLGDMEKYFQVSNFIETDSVLRFLLEFAQEVSFPNKNEFEVAIVTNANAVRFTGSNRAFINYDRTDFFSFWRFKSGFKSIGLRGVRELGEVSFTIERMPTKTIFKGNFKELNIDVLQTFINATRREKFEYRGDTDIFLLYNKDGNRRVIITYHDGREWFEIEIL